MLSFVITILLMMTVILILSSCFFIVREKTNIILETLGKYSRTVKPGLAFKLPYPITQKVAAIDMKLKEVDQKVDIKTQDNVFVSFPVKVQFRVSDAKMAYYELDKPEEQITSYVLNIIRGAVASQTFEDLYTEREKIEKMVSEALTEKMQGFGFIIENVLVDQPEPDKEVRDAFNQVIASQRKREAAINEAEAKRLLLVGQATAEKEAKKLHGEGIALEREAIANGFNKAVEALKGENINEETILAILTMTNHYDTLRDVAKHGNTILINGQAEDTLKNFTNYEMFYKSKKEKQ